MNEHRGSWSSGMKAPTAPAALKARVLAAARRGAASAGATQGLPERLLANRTVRLAWAGTVALLLFANLVLALSSGAPPPAHRPARPGLDDPLLAALADGKPAPATAGAVAQRARAWQELDEEAVSPSPRDRGGANGGAA